VSNGRPSRQASSRRRSASTRPFPAWHYADTNLWASLASHILESLSAHVSPTLSPREREAALVGNLASANELGITHVDFVLVSHGDADHLSGIIGRHSRAATADLRHKQKLASGRNADLHQPGHPAIR
jgi:hypothetical protein